MTSNDAHDATAHPAGPPADSAGGRGDRAVERLLARADTARSLAPLEPHQIGRLKESAMSRAAHEPALDAPNPTPNPAAGGRPARTRRRRRLGWAIAVGAAAAVLAGAGVAVAMQKASPPPVTELAAGPGNGAPIAMKCAEITPDMLAGYADVAFEATVTHVSDGTVTLSVTDRYAGEVADVVEVPQGDDVLLDGMPLHYDEGGTYLIAASDGAILTCGQSGPATPDLEQLYAAAFGR
jgi:hypothetical protein